MVPGETTQICELVNASKYLFLLLYVYPFSIMSLFVLMADQKSGWSHLNSLFRPFRTVFGIIISGFLIVFASHLFFPTKHLEKGIFIGYSLVGLSPLAASAIIFKNAYIFIKRWRMPSLSRIIFDLCSSLAVFFILNLVLHIFFAYFTGSECQLK